MMETYVMTDKDGTECISNFKPVRVLKSGCWGVDENLDKECNKIVELPKGTIYRLIGETLSWVDSPKKLKVL